MLFTFQTDRHSSFLICNPSSTLGYLVIFLHVLESKCFGGSWEAIFSLASFTASRCKHHKASLVHWMRLLLSGIPLHCEFRRSCIHSKKSFSYFKKKILILRKFFLKQENFSWENSKKIFLDKKIYKKIFLKTRNIFLF